VAEPHPTIHIRYHKTVEIVQVVEEWRNREDSQGGPGYYEKENLLGSVTKALTLGELRTALRDMYG
jgi:SH3-like domain-containing protein